MQANESTVSSRAGRAAWLALAAPVLAAALAACGGAPRSGTGVAENAGPDRPPSEELVERFKSEGMAWLRSERDRHHPRSVALSDDDRRRYAPYFSRHLLDRVRIVEVQGFENPAFFSIFDEGGEPHPVDLRKASAMALIDTVLISESASAARWRDRLIFHELVHVAQFEILGVERYMESYVDGWARNGRRYLEIPHERQAFALARRFASGGGAFSVEAEVRDLLAAERPGDAAPATSSVSLGVEAPRAGFGTVTCFTGNRAGSA